MRPEKGDQLVKTITLTLTEDEASAVRYALNELGGRRREQFVERGSKGDDGEAKLCYALAARVSAAVKEAK